MTGRGFRLGLGGLTALLLLACAAASTETAPRFAPEPPPADEDAARRMGRPAPSQPDRVVGRNARISEIAAMVEGERVRFTLRGTLPDGCTTIRGVRATRADRRITLVVWTERPQDAMCTMALTPFSRSVSLKTEGLSPGAYTVRVGSEETTFSLPPDAPPQA
jgi:hypothetical protein